ncbi:MAG: CYTH and CHAD domain-containing protein [Actinomycetota bacterium]|nr:CYTH and CHAD domain-containing protein [Actinomycetota bacterium]
MRELELKFSLPASFSLSTFHSEAAGVSDIEELPELLLRAIYYDTDDLRLARSGVTLRYRSGEGDKSGWTLKLPSEDSQMLAREELFFVGTPGHVPEAASDLVTAFARHAQLKAVAALRTKRRRWTLLDSGGDRVAELSDDEVSIVEGRRVVARFRELELEALSVGQEDLKRIGVELRNAGAMSAEPIPKAVRALGARATAPDDIPEPSDLSPASPAIIGVTAAIAQSLRRIVSNDPRTRLQDVEGVHQMRVGARRLRSDLGTFAPLIEAERAAVLNDELKWLADALGEVRDLDVLEERLKGDARKIGVELDDLWSNIEVRRIQSLDALDQVLLSDRYKSLLDLIIEYAREPKPTPKAEGECRVVLPPLAAAAWDRFVHRARAVKRSDSDDSWHGVRIAAKRARYAAEAVAPSLPKSSRSVAERLGRLAEQAQEILGIHQDAVTAAGIVHAYATAHRRDASLNFSTGRLIEMQRRTARDAKESFSNLVVVLGKKKNRSWPEG